MAAESRLRPYVADLAVRWAGADPGGHERIRVVAGTLALFDVSGFTRMTERLGALGPAGAELMGIAIDGVFAPVIDELARRGGDVLKFGGDALLVLFEGADHAPRAVAAGAAVLRTLVRLGRADTPIGPVRVRMKGAIHTDAFTFFMTGGTHRELLLAGRAASTVVALEARAGVGRLAVSATTAAAVPRPWTKPNDDGTTTVRLAMADRGAAATPVAPRTHGGDLCRLVPIALEPLLGRADLGDHRRLAVAFVGVDGSDELAADGTAPLLARIDDVVAAIDAAVTELGICWLKSDIGVDQVRFVLVAGLPSRSDDDDGRMLRAVRLVADRCPGLRVGVHSGAVFVADAGNERRRAFDLWGDVPNVAARLMVHADPGTIRASRHVLGGARAMFETTDLPAFRVKGKRAPLDAALVGAAIADAVAGGDATPLVGRDDEVAVLRTALDRARAGHGGVVQLVGEAGVGKSRLVSTLHDAADDVTWLAARGDAYEVARPYRAFGPLLRTALLDAERSATAGRDEIAAAIDARATAHGPWTPLLGVALGVAAAESDETVRLDPAFVRTKLHEVVLELLASLAAHPLVIECEDVHWFDDASLDLARAITAVAAERGWLVVATSRPEGPLLEGATHVVVGSLAAADAAALARAVAGTSRLDGDEAARLAARAGGNPLFVRELTRVALASDGSLPDTLERVIGMRLDTLGPADRRTLRDVSVGGGAVRVALLAAVLERDDLPAAVEGGPLGAFVVVDDDVLRFRHDLVRAVAYDGLPFRRRRVVHGRIADELAAAHGSADARSSAAAIARHFYDADRRADAWTWLPPAMDLARRSGAWVELSTLLRMALDCAPGDRDAAPNELAEELGDVSERLGLNDRSLAAYADVRRRARDDVLLTARILRKEGRVLERAGRYTESLRRLGRSERLLAALGETDRALAARVETRLAQSVTRFFQGRFGPSIELAELALADATALDDRRAIAQAHLQLEMSCSELGRPERAAHGARALALFEELGDDLGLGNLLLNLGVSEYNESNWGAALDCYHRAASAYERAGDVVGAASTVNNEAEILTDQGRYAEADERLARAARMYREAQYASGDAVTTSGRARLELRAGRVDAALHLLATARQRFVALGAAAYVLDTDVRRVEALVVAGLAAEALELAAVTQRELDAHGDVAILPITLQRLVAVARAQLDQHGVARQVVADALERARRESVPFEVLQLLVVVSTLGGADGSTGADHADEIARLRDRLGVVDLPAPPLPPR